MEWRKPEEAPKGAYKETDVKSIRGNRTMTQFCPDRIIGTNKDGFVCETYWIPAKERGSRSKVGRWHKFSDNEELAAWMPMPEWRE